MSLLNSVISAETFRSVFWYMNNRYGKVHIAIHQDSILNNPHRALLKSYIKNGIVILNVGGNAVKHLSISSEGVSFEARFNGTPLHCHFEHNEILGVQDFDSGLFIVTNLLLGTHLDGHLFSVALEDNESPDDSIERIDDNTPKVSGVEVGNVVHVNFGKKK